MSEQRTYNTEPLEGDAPNLYEPLQSFLCSNETRSTSTCCALERPSGTAVSSESHCAPSASITGIRALAAAALVPRMTALVWQSLCQVTLVLPSLAPKIRRRFRHAEEQPRGASFKVKS